MKKVKLPRKRKKAFIKDHAKGTYMMHIIMSELLLEENNNPLNRRFYKVRNFRKGEIKNKNLSFTNGYKIIKKY